mgnify:CR=1 FL=1
MKYLIHILIFVFLMVASSCEENIDVNLNTGEQQRLVVEGGITTQAGKSHQVKLTSTTDYFSEKEIPAVTHASVMLSDGKQQYTLSETSPGIYQTDSTEFTATTGKTYRLDIQLDNGEEYWAEEKLSYVPTIDTAGYEFKRGFFGEYYYYSITFSGKEKPTDGDTYLWNLYLDGKLYNDTLRESSFAEDDFIKGAYVENIEVYTIPEDEINQDTTHVRLEILSISHDYYVFMIEALSETAFRGGPFQTPPANVSTNIRTTEENPRPMGYFCASDVSSYEFDLINVERP